MQRLTEELKNMPVDLERGYRLERAVVASLRSFARYKGWVIVQRTDDDGMVVVWRVK